MRRALVLLALLTLVPLAACGDDGGSGGGEGAGEVETTPLTFGDGSEVWLRVETGGGFVPVIVNLRQHPSLLLFDDGRLVRAASDDPFAIVPRFERAQLAEAEVAGLLDDAAAAVDGPDVGEPPITDHSTTTIEVTTDGETRSLDVYALGVDEGLTDDQEDARAAVDELLTELDAVGEAGPFVPDGWLALTTATLEGADIAAEADIVDWPLEPDRAASADVPAVCTRLSGEDADDVLEALDDSDESTYLRAGPSILEVALRPVLTGDETCDSVQGIEPFVER